MFCLLHLGGKSSIISVFWTLNFNLKLGAGCSSCPSHPLSKWICLIKLSKHQYFQHSWRPFRYLVSFVAPLMNEHRLGFKGYMCKNSLYPVWKKKPIIDDVEYELTIDRDALLTWRLLNTSAKNPVILNVMFPSVAKPAGIILVM